MSTGGCDVSATTAAARRSASMGNSGHTAATAAEHRSVSTGGCGHSAVMRRRGDLRAWATAGTVPRLRWHDGLRAWTEAVPVPRVRQFCMSNPGLSSARPPIRRSAEFAATHANDARRQPALSDQESLRCTKHSATHRSPLSTSSTCPSAAAGWSRRRRTPSRTLPCRLRGATSCWRLTRSSIRPTTQLRRAQGL